MGWIKNKIRKQAAAKVQIIEKKKQWSMINKVSLLPPYFLQEFQS
jgi:hypothetical protein